LHWSYSKGATNASHNCGTVPNWLSAPDACPNQRRRGGSGAFNVARLDCQSDACEYSPQPRGSGRSHARGELLFQADGASSIVRSAHRPRDERKLAVLCGSQRLAISGQGERGNPDDKGGRG